MTSTIYTGTDDHGTEFLLTVWPDGAHEIATREGHRTWGPPVLLVAQPSEVCS